jgi:hypothetical protein
LAEQEIPVARHYADRSPHIGKIFESILDRRVAKCFACVVTEPIFEQVPENIQAVNISEGSEKAIEIRERFR